MVEETKPASGNDKDSSKKSLSNYINKENKVVVIIVGLVVLFGLLAVFNSLSNKATQTVSDKIIETAVNNASSDAKVDVNNGSYTVKDNNGNTGTYDSNSTISDDFPKEVPLYGNETISGNIRNATSQGVTWVVSATTDDSFAIVKQFVEDSFKGWENTVDYTINNTISKSYKKGNLEVSLVVTAGTDRLPGTSITYSAMLTQ